METHPRHGRQKAPVFLAALYAALLTTALFANGAAALPRHAAVPGGVALIPLEVAGATPPRAWLGERPLAVLQDHGRWVALLGIALDTTPGPLELRIETDGKRRQKQIVIADKAYPSQHLRVRDQSKVTPGPAEQLRIAREQVVLDRIKQTFSPAPPDSDFGLPAAAPLSSRFGLRRYFNGEARNPHSGLDLRTGAGKAVVAAATGTVLDTGDYFFGGTTVFLDHGQGLISAYMHLARTDVRPGQRVERGTPLGLSGSSGRATGPHLHWSVFLNGVAVDPELFLPSRSTPTQRRQ